MAQRFINIMIVIVLGIVLGGVVAEVGFRIVFPQYVPQYIYRVLYFQPDEDIGWKMHPDFEFDWRGRNTACVEFETQIQTNSWGFRDIDWSAEKPDNTIRIAVIGDSFVEALQVDVQDRATELLEKSLHEAYPDREFEVMNFGVSNYSLGQMALVYENEVAQFEPDYVFVLSAYFQMMRNSSDSIAGAEVMQSLKIRPIYTIDDDGQLQLQEAEDYQEFVEIIEAQDSLIRRVEPGERHSPLLTLEFLSRRILVRNPPIHPRNVDPNEDQIFPQVDENYLILEQMQTDVQANGAELIFVDMFDYFEVFDDPAIPGSGVLAQENQAFTAAHDIGYIDLSTQLRLGEDRMIFPCDHHFTATGNGVFADAMFEWLENDL